MYWRTCHPHSHLRPVAAVQVVEVRFFFLDGRAGRAPHKPRIRPLLLYSQEL